MNNSIIIRICIRCVRSECLFVIMCVTSFVNHVPIIIRKRSYRVKKEKRRKIDRHLSVSQFDLRMHVSYPTNFTRHLRASEPN